MGKMNITLLFRPFVIRRPMFFNTTVFPQIGPAGIIFLQGLQMRVLLERGY